MISRRSWLAGAAALGACGPRLAKRFNGYALVANRGSRTLAVVNLTRFKTEKQIALGAAPDQILAHAEDRAALILLPETGTVVEVTAESLATGKRRKVSDRATQMRLSGDGRPGDGRRLWVLASEPQELVSIDLPTWKRGRRIPLPYAAHDFDVTPEGERAVVAYIGRKQCAFIDLQTGRVGAEIDLAADASVVRFRPDGKMVLIGSGAGRTITFVDRASGKVLVMLPVPFAPERFCFTLPPDSGGQMFATGPGMDAVAIVYPYQTEIAETVLAGREPGAMTVNQTLLFVTNPPTGDTTVIAIAERQVVARISSGEEPCAVTLTPDGEYALVLNRKSGDMAVVRISKLTDLRYKRAPLFTVIAVGEEPVGAVVARL